MLVYAVVLNWNDAESTVRCVRSILAANTSPDEVIVVDNHSSEVSFSELQAQLPDTCHLLRTAQNEGYAGGMRVGAAFCLEKQADLIWFLNNDLEVTPDTLSELLAAVHRNGLRSMYSPKILYRARPQRAYFRGMYLDAETGDFLPDIEGVEKVYGATDDDLYSDAIQGASFIMPAALIRSLGFMDESYFLYFEEFDYSLRLAQHGITSICVLSAIAFHDTARSDEPLALQQVRVYYRARNKILLWRRHCSLPQTSRYFLRYLWKEVRSFASERHGADRLTRSAWVLGVWHGLLGKGGRTYYPLAE